ncbi:hypothetical protein, partial [Pseudomonas corrugata]|uniref:hypothetical protein n=1 Tax=Pseudomonas corrugata TaxID=47879 RepID=UPI003D9B2B5F
MLAKPTMLPIPRHRIRNGHLQIPEAQPQRLLALARVETENLWEQSLLAMTTNQSTLLLTDLPQSRASFAPTGLW